MPDPDDLPSPRPTPRTAANGPSRAGRVPIRRPKLRAREAETQTARDPDDANAASKLDLLAEIAQLRRALTHKSTKTATYDAATQVKEAHPAPRGATPSEDTPASWAGRVVGRPKPPTSAIAARLQHAKLHSATPRALAENFNVNTRTSFDSAAFVAKVPEAAATSSKRPRSAPAKRPAPSVKKGPALYTEPFPRPEGTLAFGGIAR